MLVRMNWLFFLTVVSWISICSSNVAIAQGWQAGVAKVSITPTEPTWMAGYASRNGPSEGVMVELFARALALCDAMERRLVIVSLDIIEIPHDLRIKLLEVAKRHQLNPREILFNVSHTHGGPMVSSKTVKDWGIDSKWADRAEAYVEQLVSKVDEAIGTALKNITSVTLSYGRSRCDIAMNRRLKTPEGFRLSPNPDGPVDHAVPVLKIESSTAALLGVVYGYACHNTTLGGTRRLNGDFAGFASQKLETDHPGAVALFLTGCGGDQDPRLRGDGDEAERNGHSLASAVEAALNGPTTMLRPIVATSLEECAIPFSPLPPRNELENRAKSANGFVARHARWILEKWPDPGQQPEDYPLPIQVIRLGDTFMLVALGGEPVVDYSLRLEPELQRVMKQLPDSDSEEKCIWIAGYSNLVNAYVPSRRVLLEGGYEGTEAIIYQSLPCPFDTDIEQRIAKSVNRQAATLLMP